MTRPGYGTKLDSVEVVHQGDKGACILSRLVRLDTLLLRCRCGCGSVCVQRQQTSTQGTTGWSPYLLIRIIARLSKVVFLLAILLFASTSHVVSALYSRFMPHAKRACASQFYGSRRCDWDHGRAQLWMARQSRSSSTLIFFIPTTPSHRVLFLPRIRGLWRWLFVLALLVRVTMTMLMVMML